MEKTTLIQGQDGDVQIGVTFTKIDRENRIVSGFATLDNIDGHGDIVSANGSADAFKRFRGGLREMHQPNAVGTIVSFEETKKYDRDTDKVYGGIYVNAKVSKGAPNTWEKVLDGTYRGFSIGGKIKRRSRVRDDDGTEHNVIEDYDLIELSLVDNPANPLANVLTVQKIGDTYVYPELEKQVMNILLHEETGDVILAEDAERDGFINIGWTDSVDNTEKIRLALDTHYTSTEGFTLSNDGDVLLNETEDVILAGADNTNEGGATVATDTKIEKDAGEVESDQGVVQSADTSEVDESAEVENDDADTDEENEEVEKAADVTEVEEEVVTDPADEIVAKVQAAVADVLAKATDAAKESTDAVTSVKTSFDKSLEDFENKISELKSDITKELESLAQRVEDVESDTAVKKSADVVNDDDAGENNEEDSFWRGSGFLGVNDLFKG